MHVRILLQITTDDRTAGVAEEITAFEKSAKRPEDLGLSLAEGKAGVKLPILLRPLLAAAAVGLAVSAGQYVVTLDVAPGVVVAEMGLSGSGKSSLLAWVCGTLDRALRGAGRVLLDGADVTGLPAERRRIGILFQDDLMFPHLSVGGNLGFGLPPGPGRRAWIEAALAEGRAARHGRTRPGHPVRRPARPRCADVGAAVPAARHAAGRAVRTPGCRAAGPFPELRVQPCRGSRAAGAAGDARGGGRRHSGWGRGADQASAP